MEHCKYYFDQSMLRSHYKGKMVPQGTIWNFDYDFDHEQNVIVKDVLVNYALKTADDLGCQWTAEVLEEKLAVVFKNAKFHSKLTLQQRETEKERYQECGVRNKVHLYLLLSTCCYKYLG